MLYRGPVSGRPGRRRCRFGGRARVARRSSHRHADRHRTWRRVVRGKVRADGKSRQIEQQVAPRPSVSAEDVRQLRFRQAEATEQTEEPRIAARTRFDKCCAMRCGWRRPIFSNRRCSACAITPSASGAARPRRFGSPAGGGRGTTCANWRRRRSRLTRRAAPAHGGRAARTTASASDNTPPLGEWAVAYGLALRDTAPAKLSQP